jgi:hypothetical protein
MERRFVRAFHEENRLIERIGWLHAALRGEVAVASTAAVGSFIDRAM